MLNGFLVVGVVLVLLMMALMVLLLSHWVVKLLFDYEVPQVDGITKWEYKDYFSLSFDLGTLEDT